jgi:hypothetical protein
MFGWFAALWNCIVFRLEHLMDAALFTSAAVAKT